MLKAVLTMVLTGVRRRVTRATDDHRPALEEMIRHVSSQAEIFRPSRGWQYFEQRNGGQLAARGLENFKRTINQNYFNWILSGPNDNQFKAVARMWADAPSLDAFKVELFDYQDLEGFFENNPLLVPEARELYRIFLGMLWQHTRTSDPHGLTEVLEEPLLGNPLGSRLKGRLISQDLANSIRERNAILAPVESAFAGGRRVSIVELGAGYGRLGYVLLCSAPCRYTIVDIPTALHVSQWYLTTLFPAKKAFRFKPWDRFDEVADELRSADLCFLTPDQYARLPDRFFDIGIAISNLGEMSRQQCAMYIDLFDRKVSEFVYIKQWRSNHNPLDDVEFQKSDYDLPAPWTAFMDRPDAVQDLFFETLWRRA
ncbi:MAG: putative sugar O-methyltransferase [Betaproteobacteria bacterium]|nr:putative sugar O-methyltransferase [Betaproteobacteria bacterium]